MKYNANQFKINALIIPSDRSGVSYYRSTNPHIFLQEQYPEEFHVDIDYTPNISDESFIKNYDIIHFHKTIGNYHEAQEKIKKINSLGVKTVIDVDDYWSPGQHHPAHAIIKKDKIDYYIMENLKASNYVTTTTPIFAEEIKKLNKNVFVIPNAIDVNEKQFIPNPEKSDRIRIGFIGGSSHLTDIELLGGVVNRLISDKLINKVQFVLCGYDLRGFVNIIDERTGKRSQRKIKPHESVWFKYEKVFTDDYRSVSKEYKDFLLKFENTEYPNIENEPYRREWTKPITSYATHYNKCDVLLAPLVENIFNKNKSPLKVAESGVFKKALIAQEFGPYTIDLVNGIEFGGKINEKGNALLVNSNRNHKDWYRNIKRLIETPELITMLGENLHKTIIGKYDMATVIKTRRDFYRKIVS